MAQGPEAKFKNNVVLVGLKTLANTYVMTISQQSLVGDPDLILCVNGHFVALELKSCKGRIAPLQRYKLEKIKEAKGMAYAVYPKDWPKVFKELEKLAKGEI